MYPTKTFLLSSDDAARDNHVILVLVTLPRDATTLHVVGQCDIIAPHIKLPFAQAQNATVHTTSVNTNPHVHIHTHNIAD